PGWGCGSTARRPASTRAPAFISTWSRRGGSDVTSGRAEHRRRLGQAPLDDRPGGAAHGGVGAETGGEHTDRRPPQGDRPLPQLAEQRLAGSRPHGGGQVPHHTPHTVA